MKRNPPQEAIDEALTIPNGWVYEIDDKFKNGVEVPPQGIKGAWQVNEKGQIVGDFIPNPNYQDSSNT